MGCYGIGIGRTVAAAIEQNHDDDGIIFPSAIAPFHVQVVPVNLKQEGVREAAEKIYSELQEVGLEVLLDDREERPGIKFKDADLIGAPIRVTVSRKKVERGFLELKKRKSGEEIDVQITEAVASVKAVIEQECTRWED
jgi:prolyl-tRNA synthetase